MNFYLLFGNPVGHSFSPQLHSIIYEEANINASYKSRQLAPDQLEAAIDALKVLDIGGANVTIPYKKAFFQYIDELSDLARALNAVNTLKQVNGHIIGYNTDYDGIGFSFRVNGWNIQDKDVYILGTGGASLTVAYYLQNNGAKSVTIVTRDKHKMHDDPFERIDYQDLETITGDILINGTPVGMHPHVDDSPVTPEIISHFDGLFDLTYNPAVTKFLSYGQMQNKQTMNGLDMLIGQAIKSVEIWEEIIINESTIERIRQRVKEVLNQ